MFPSLAGQLARHDGKQPQTPCRRRSSDILRAKIDLDELNCTCASLVPIRQLLLPKDGTPAATCSPRRKWVASTDFEDFQENPAGTAHNLT